MARKARVGAKTAASVLELDLQGWFSDEEGAQYQLEAARRPHGHIVEVGTWKGRSTSFLAPVLTGLPQRLWCVDHWRGAQDQYAGLYRELLTRSAGRDLSVRAQLEVNLELLGIPAEVLELESVEAAAQFEAGSCALILLDASHDEASVGADLRAWWPKLQPGGLLLGHDWSDDHPGLKRAVRAFADELRVSVRVGPGTLYALERPG